MSHCHVLKNHLGMLLIVNKFYWVKITLQDLVMTQISSRPTWGTSRPECSNSHPSQNYKQEGIQPHLDTHSSKFDLHKIEARKGCRRKRRTSLKFWASLSFSLSLSFVKVSTTIGQGKIMKLHQSYEVARSKLHRRCEAARSNLWTCKVEAMKLILGQICEYARSKLLNLHLGWSCRNCFWGRSCWRSC